MSPVLLLGELRDPELFVIVAGGPLDGAPATLDDFDMRWDREADGTVLVPRAGSSIAGLRVVLDAGQRDRLAFYAAACGLVLRQVRIATAREQEDALAFVRDGADGAPWDLERWQRDRGAEARFAAEEAMRHHGRIDGRALNALMPTIRVRAASRARAAASRVPRTRRCDLRRDAVRVLDRRDPYVAFFAVDETDLAHPRFDGSSSGPLTRAAFVSGDAVTVLPYDPVRDRVMLVDQFRFGPYARGDAHPWVLEPIAGRIDPGETPEAAARREAVEEAGLALGRLVPVASHYPSPGAMTEYIWSFVALVDLPDDAAGFGGAADEGEDIRTHVMDFDALMRLVESGEADTAPLLLTIFWLEHRRRSLT